MICSNWIKKTYNKLDKIGIYETYASILNKMSRGTFQFSFFYQCAVAIGIKNLWLDYLAADESE